MESENPRLHKTDLSFKGESQQEERSSGLVVEFWASIFAKGLTHAAGVQVMHVQTAS